MAKSKLSFGIMGPRNIFFVVLMYCEKMYGSFADITDFTLYGFRQCEPIRVEMCRNNGYNETSMPNLVGMELQRDVELTLQTFEPLIELVCSTQLKLLLCAVYVPMCTSKVPTPIGPCRTLCENVRSRCQPVLNGFGFPWPPALDCGRFPKGNNHETMCMEGPGDGGSRIQNSYETSDLIHRFNSPKQHEHYDCPAIGKAHLYMRFHHTNRCASQRCEADVLFGPHEKHLSEVWISTWTYAALGFGVIAIVCFFFPNKTTMKWSCMLKPLVWCHCLVSAGWTVRFLAGRTKTACGYDSQYSNISVLLVDGLSNPACAANFLLRYYFGMAACVWWAILCLGWHREIRRKNPESANHITLSVDYSPTKSQKLNNSTNRKQKFNITKSNIARFAAWSLPAFQTTSVIVARFVDADELLGACFVGNQSDKALQILVATPLFCYWIFGSMNLISGCLVHRRTKKIVQSEQSQRVKEVHRISKSCRSGLGTFLCLYCVPYSILLAAVIYEFLNIDVWLNVTPIASEKEGITTPMWPFLTRALMELMLGIICFAWILGPKISTTYKRKLTPRRSKNGTISQTHFYQTVRQVPNHLSVTMPLYHIHNYSSGLFLKCVPTSSTQQHIGYSRKQKSAQVIRKYNNLETIL